MDPTYGFTPPALDQFGGVHFTGDEDQAKAAETWTGDPSSVPLPSAHDEHDGAVDGEAVDRAIFVALVSA